MPEAKGVSPIFSCSSAVRCPRKPCWTSLGIKISSHDFAFRVDRVDLRVLGAASGHVNVDCRIDALAQDEAMLIAVGIDVESYNLCQRC